MWDASGDKDYHALVDSYLPRAAAVVIAIDLGADRTPRSTLPAASASSTSPTSSSSTAALPETKPYKPFEAG